MHSWPLRKKWFTVWKPSKITIRYIILWTSVTNTQAERPIPIDSMFVNVFIEKCKELQLVMTFWTIQCNKKTYNWQYWNVLRQQLNAIKLV
jgi:hypothetical protein